MIEVKKVQKGAKSNDPEFKDSIKQTYTLLTNMLSVLEKLHDV